MKPKADRHLWAKAAAGLLLGMMGLVLLGIGACLALVWAPGYLVPGILAGAAGLALWVVYRPGPLPGIPRGGMES